MINAHLVIVTTNDGDTYTGKVTLDREGPVPNGFEIIHNDRPFSLPFKKHVHVTNDRYEEVEGLIWFNPAHIQSVVVFRVDVDDPDDPTATLQDDDTLDVEAEEVEIAPPTLVEPEPDFTSRRRRGKR